MGCDTVWSCRSLPMFLRNLMPPFSEQKVNFFWTAFRCVHSIPVEHLWILLCLSAYKHIMAWEWLNRFLWNLVWMLCHVMPCNFKLVPYNFLQSVIPMWQMLELVWWEDNPLQWCNYPWSSAMMSLSVMSIFTYTTTHEQPKWF
jgi:hypothetical protein